MNSNHLICVLSVLVFTVIIQPVAAGSATLTNNVFNNVVMAIATIEPNDDSYDLHSFIKQLKDLMRNTSSVMYSATDNRLSFGTITILLPANWENWNTTQKLQTVQSSNIPYNHPSFDTADIRVDITNVAYGFMPYTQQSGFCGERGDFIHITYDFIMGKYDQLKYGTQSKLLAREWVKYYFGVFDEQGYNYDYMYPVKYFAAGAATALNLCTTIYPSWETYSCDSDSAVLGLPLSCDLEVEQYQSINTSMMSLTLTPIALKFCSENNHNSYAPNKHNIMCDGKSVMEIILQNSQVENSGTFKFADANFMIDQLTFNNTMAMAIFWDNMKYETSTYSALPSLSKFIQYDLPSNAWISLQESIKEDLTQLWTQITSDDDRAIVLEAIADVTPEQANDTFTIETFDNLIQSAMNMTDNVKVLLFVSASDIPSDDWTYMCESALEHNFQIRLISYSTSSVANFMSNNNCTGKAILIKAPTCPYSTNTWTTNQNECKKCCAYLQERKLFDDFIRVVPNSVVPNLYGPPQTFYEALGAGEMLDTFYLTLNSDSRDNRLTTRFYLETCENMNLSMSHKPSCEIENCRSETIDCYFDSNATQTYCANQIICESYSSMLFQCQEHYDTIPYSVYVVGQPSNSIIDPYEPSANLYSWSVVDYQSPYARVRIFARLVIGTTPIFNANVQATIVSEYSTTITLRDDGSGNPDVSANDGVYSAYFTQFYTGEVYTVTVTATDTTIDSPTYTVSSTYPTSSYPWISGLQSMDELATGPFTRVVSAGSFYIDPSKAEDIVGPPGKIMDLQVNYSTNHEVCLQWTTPGAYLDYGDVNGYYLKCSIYKVDLNESNFYPTNSPFFSSKQTAGSTSQHIISGEYDFQTHYCSIITCNTNNYCSAPSNIVTYSIIDWSTPDHSDDRHHNIVLWSCVAVAIAVVVLIIVIVIVILLCRERITFVNKLLGETTTTSTELRETTTTSTELGEIMSSNDIDDRNSVSNANNSQSENSARFLDQPPSYENVVIN